MNNNNFFKSNLFNECKTNNVSKLDTANQINKNFEQIKLSKKIDIIFYLNKNYKISNS